MKQLTNKYTTLLVVIFMIPLIGTFAQSKNSIVVTNDMHGTVIKPNSDKIDFNLADLDVGNYVKIESYDQNGNMFYTVLKRTHAGVDVGIDKNSIERNHPTGVIQFARENKVFKNLQLNEVTQERCLGWLCLAALFCCVEISYTSTDGEIIIIWNCNCTDPM